MQWIGAKDTERRNDELLQYLFQARNDDEHGIEEVVEHVAEMMAIGHAGPWSPDNMMIIDLNSPGHMKIASNTPVAVERLPAHAALRPVKDIGGNIYQPPTTHKGAYLTDNSPVAVARLGLIHLAAVLEEAEELIVP
jgi:hypothetical protein